MRKSNATVQGYRMEDGTVLPGAVFPSGRVAIYREGLIMFYHDCDRVPLVETSLSEGSRPHPRKGVGYRTEDTSGVSGEGIVFDFVELGDGWVVQEWRNDENPGLLTEGEKDSGIDFRPSMSLAVQIHGHDGRTEYVYDNGEIGNETVAAALAEAEGETEAEAES